MKTGMKNISMARIMQTLAQRLALGKSMNETRFKKYRQSGRLIRFQVQKTGGRILKNLSVRLTGGLRRNEK
jgi:hypothetical protein